MGKDKLKRFSEIKTFENVIQPKLDYSSVDFLLKGKWSDVFKNDNPIILELGCGGGEYTIGLAKHYPKINFIGIDIKGARLWKGAKNAIDSLRNASQFFCFATGSLPKPAQIKLNQCNIWNTPELIATSKTSLNREGFVLDAIKRSKLYYNISHFDEIISVGDGIWDLKTAQNLDLNFIGIGLKNKELLLQNGCKTWFENMTDFRSNLK